MMQLKDVYKIPGKIVPLSEWVISESWIPEVPNWSAGPDCGGPSYELLQALTVEGLIQVKQLVNELYEGDRYAAMYTVVFKDMPVAIIQEAGRGGRDHYSRWVTNAPGFWAMCQYLHFKLAFMVTKVEEDDPEQMIYPEEVFQFYGNYFGTEFGYEKEPITKGFLTMKSEKGLIPGINPEYVLVTAVKKFNVMPEYIRRGAYVLRKVGPVSEEELARNPRVRLVSEEDQHPNIYWYQPASRPIDEPVLSI
ncbi:MAG: hypothetical protein Q7S87_03150 [Agitococcus sp.]|nr:hypothetical protein [Agitococcus sp.]MDO9178633.1 hypothetical protein [Agitococcus sp.]